MLRKMNLFSTLFALTLMLAAVATAQAFAVFTVGGVKMICRTCMCGEMASAGVPLEHCVDFMVTANPKPYTKLIRYSESDVRLLAADGTQSPLSSDAAQSQFDQISRQRNFQQQVGRLRPTKGAISASRLERLAKELGVEIVSSEDLDDKAAEEPRGAATATVLVTIRDGRILSIRSAKGAERIKLAADVFRARATSRDGKVILQFERPLARETRAGLKIDAALDLDRETGTALDTCGCLPGNLLVEDGARTPVVTIQAHGRPRHAHKWSTKYRTFDCPRW